MTHTAPRLALLVAAVAALGLVPEAAAGESTDRLKEVERKIERAREEAKSIEVEAKGVLAEMEKLDRSIGDRDVRVGELAAEIRSVEERKAEADRRLAALDAELPRLRSRLASRARGLHRLARRGLAPVLFQAPRDWSETQRYRRSLEAVLAHDRMVAAALARNRSDAEATRAEADADAARLLERRAESERELQSLRAEQKSKKRLLASLKGEGEKRDRLVGELRASAERLKALIDKESASKAPPFQPAPGQAGRMLSPLRAPARQIATARNGVEIRAAAGTPIQAVRAGRVVFAGWFAGYGKMVILDHGDHLYSVYGYASDLAVEQGAVVAAGDVIGMVGATGPATSASLYFEIRKRGVPHDPKNYIPALTYSAKGQGRGGGRR